LLGHVVISEAVVVIVVVIENEKAKTLDTITTTTTTTTTKRTNSRPFPDGHYSADVDLANAKKSRRIEPPEQISGQPPNQLPATLQSLINPGKYA
jgi:hypothetical protein